MSTTSATVADACRMIAERTGDQEAAHILRQAGEALDRLTAALAAAPVREERAERCWCRKSCVVEIDGERFWMVQGEKVSDYVETWKLDADVHCWDCGAHLGEDGIARRNADSARVQRVRKLLDTPVPRGVPGAPSPYMQPGIEFAIKKVRAALDPEEVVGGGN